MNLVLLLLIYYYELTVNLVIAIMNDCKSGIIMNGSKSCIKSSDDTKSSIKSGDDTKFSTKSGNDNKSCNIVAIKSGDDSKSRITMILNNTEGEA